MTMEPVASITISRWLFSFFFSLVFKWINIESCYKSAVVQICFFSNRKYSSQRLVLDSHVHYILKWMTPFAFVTCTNANTKTSIKNVLWRYVLARVWNMNIVIVHGVIYSRRHDAKFRFIHVHLPIRRNRKKWTRPNVNKKK